FVACCAFAIVVLQTTAITTENLVMQFVMNIVVRKPFLFRESIRTTQYLRSLPVGSRRVSLILNLQTKVWELEPGKAVAGYLGVGHPFSRPNASEFAYQGFGVSQEFPFPGKLALASEEARREAESEQQQYRATVLDLTARLKVAYYEWLAATKALRPKRARRDPKRQDRAGSIEGKPATRSG